MNKEEVIQIVSKHVSRNQPQGYRLQVFDGSAHQDGDYWVVAVGPDREGIRRYDYYDDLAKIQREIEDEEPEDKSKISLFPPPSGAVDAR